MAAFQLRSMLEGVVSAARPHRSAHLSGYVGGKTGTTDSANDVWFAGYTSDITVVVWIGYDNAETAQTLGDGSTGGRLAVPIAARDFRSGLEAPRAEAAAAAPSKRLPAAYARCPSTFRPDRGSTRPTAFMEHFRLRDGRVRNTHHILVSRAQANMRSGSCQWPEPAPPAPNGHSAGYAVAAARAQRRHLATAAKPCANSWAWTGNGSLV